MVSTPVPPVPAAVPFAAVAAATPIAVLVGLVRPAGLVAVVLLGLLAGALARIGLWLAGAPHADARAVRAGLWTLSAGLGLAALLLVLGPATVVVFPLLSLVAMVWWWLGHRGGPV